MLITPDILIPALNNIMTLPESIKRTEFRVTSPTELPEFETIFKDHIEADCWALTVDNEVIFNSYNPNRSHRDRLIEDTIRNGLIKYPHSLFVDIYRKEKPAVVSVYMFGANSWKMVCNYAAGVWTISFRN